MKAFLEWAEGGRFAVVHDPMGHVIKVIRAPDLREALKKVADQLGRSPRLHAVVSLEGETGVVRLFDRDETRRVPPGAFSRDGLAGDIYINLFSSERPGPRASDSLRLGENVRPGGYIGSRRAS